MKKPLRTIALILAVVFTFLVCGCTADTAPSIEESYPEEEQNDLSSPAPQPQPETEEVTPEIDSTQSDTPDKEQPDTEENTPETAPVPEQKPTPKPLLNGVEIGEYVIVYDDMALDYTLRAATYIRDEIARRVGVSLEIVTDENKATEHEIVVGETNRAISTALNAKTKGTQFVFHSENGSVAMEADKFVIAAAAYYFIENYITGKTFVTSVPASTIKQPIVKAPKNYIYLIGDGMGIYQTKLFDIKSAENYSYSDNEDIFYGYMFPYSGFAKTNSLIGVTDSAAGGTALATGYKTINGYIGKDRDLNNLTSLTELAGSMGMATAVMSTEAQTGATPSAFSAHANNRSDTADILATQKQLQQTYGTIINCGYDFYDKNGIDQLEGVVTDTLNTLSQNKNGFFLMYEEAHIDKHCHNNDFTNTFMAVLRFNQIIGICMEYAFYHPDTFVLITADHETGGLHVDENNDFVYAHAQHTGATVPVFAYGMGAELFDQQTIENIQIPKTISALWGAEIIDPNDNSFPALKKKIA